MGGIDLGGHPGYILNTHESHSEATVEQEAAGSALTPDPAKEGYFQSTGGHLGGKRQSRRRVETRNLELGSKHLMAVEAEGTQKWKEGQDVVHRGHRRGSRKAECYSAQNRIFIDCIKLPEAVWSSLGAVRTWRSFHLCSA